MTTFKPLDVIRVSATVTEAKVVPNRDVEVTKLIDVSKCIGCKACQSACMEWNDKRPAVGENVGLYENPPDLTPDMFTLMRFTEWDNPKTGNLEWLIRKDGCMHCEDPGCLKACPAPGAIVQYANGIVDFIHENCIGCGYCIKGCPFNIPRLSPVDHTTYKCTLCSDRAAVGEEPACSQDLPHSGHRLRNEEGNDRSCGRPDRRFEVSRLRSSRPLQSARRGRHACDVCASPCGSAANICRPSCKSGNQPSGGGLERGWKIRWHGSYRASGRGRRCPPSHIRC